MSAHTRKHTRTFDPKTRLGRLRMLLAGIPTAAAPGAEYQLRSDRQGLLKVAWSVRYTHPETGHTERVASGESLTFADAKRAARKAQRKHAAERRQTSAGA